MSAVLLALAGGGIAVLAAFAYYLGSRNQVMLGRAWAGTLSLVVGTVAAFVAIVLLAFVLSLASAIFTVVLLVTMLLTALPFLRLLSGTEGRRR